MDGRAAAGTGREADAAGLHALPDHLLHALQLLRGGLPLVGRLAHHHQPHRRMGHQRRDVHAHPALEIVEVLGEGRPFPVVVVDVVVEDPAQIGDQDVPRLALGGHRRDGGAAVADDDGGDAVVDHGVAVGILHDEEVHVGVGVDEPRRHHLSASVELGPARPHVLSDRRDGSPVHRHVRLETGAAGTVDHKAVLHNQIMRHGSSPF